MKLHEEFKLYENLWEAASSSTYTVLTDVGWSTTKSPNLSLDDAIKSTRNSLLADGGHVYITWIDEQTGDEVLEYDERHRIIKTDISKAKTELNKVLNAQDEQNKRDRALNELVKLFTPAELADMKPELAALKQKITQIEVARFRQL
jgi:hypothetical protein